MTQIRDPMSKLKHDCCVKHQKTLSKTTESSLKDRLPLVHNEIDLVLCINVLTFSYLFSFYPLFSEQFACRTWKS